MFAPMSSCFDSSASPIVKEINDAATKSWFIPLKKRDSVSFYIVIPKIIYIFLWLG